MAPFIRRYFSCWLLISAAIVASLPSPVAAHPEGFSGVIVKIEPAAVKVEMTLHTRDLDNWFPPLRFPDYVRDVCKSLEEQAPGIYDVQLNYAAAKMSRAKAFEVEPGLLQLDLWYDYEPPLEMVRVEFLQFPKLPRGHEQFVVVEDHRGVPVGGTVDRLLEDSINIDQPGSSKEIPPSRWRAVGSTAPATNPATNPAAVATAVPIGEAPEVERRINFFIYGLEHILFGADHLLFIAALLLACRTFGEAATIVTFFTLAHSVTLALSAMRLVNISPNFIEPAIAATIVFVAVENLLHRPKLAWRCVITLFFGLIHGLGFAKDLREKLASDSFADIVWPLVKFSAGVEAGHLALVAMALPLLLWAKQRKPAFDRVAVPVLSIVISVFGGFWLVTRVLGVIQGEG